MLVDSRTSPEDSLRPCERRTLCVFIARFECLMSKVSVFELRGGSLRRRSFLQSQPANSAGPVNFRKELSSSSTFCIQMSSSILLTLLIPTNSICA